MIRLATVLVLLACPSALAEPPARTLFGTADTPSSSQPAPHGSYAKGCLDGAERLAETGPGWQAMRLSRNRNWGHPQLIAFIGRLGAAAEDIGWPGLYVGDLSQPRGGPMRSGHRSHQIGLDADIWLRRPGPQPLSRAERERIGSPPVVRKDRRGVNANWTDSHHRLLRRAASDPGVARIFVNAAIKQALCRAEGPESRGWLRRIRPWWGHDSHFHVRLACPLDAPGCVDQAPPPPGDGCDATLAWWFTDEALNPKPKPGAKPRRALRLADLPAACSSVLAQ